MCGFAGTIRLDGSGPPSRDALARMIWAIRHRGPDGFGIYRDQHAGLAHARLAIVDLAGGAQPLADQQAARWIVFNGEIFNHRQLRSELQGLGYQFHTASDTEVVVNAFDAWGLDCFDRFNGQWAFALWNRHDRQLLLSRDPTGICPLYVRERNGAVTFASEVKAVLADPDVPRAFDPRGIDQTLTYWGAIAPITPYEGIEELRPGSYRVYTTTGRTDGVHWSPEYPPTIARFRGSLDDASDELRRRLIVASQLRVSSADVPVAAYLSGGLDSSVIALLGHGASRGPFSTYSIRFDDQEFDEGIYQRMVVDRLNSVHHELRVSRGDIAAAFPDAVWHAERPLLRTAAAPMFLLSKAVRESGVKAVLTGEGADEVLAGYDLFREARIRAFWARRPDSPVRPMLFDRIYPYLAHSSPRARGMAHAFWKVGLDHAGQPGFSHAPRWRSAAALKRFYTTPFSDAVVAAAPPDHLDSLPSSFPTWSTLSQAQYLELTTLLSSYILSSQGDRQLLANGVEGRFPFLDRGLIDFCNSLPDAYKLSGLDEKHVLKRMATDLVPREILERKKQPYRAPDAVCFFGPKAPDYVRELMSERAVADSAVFEPRAVTALVSKMERLAADPINPPTTADNMAMVAIISVQLLHHHLLTPAPTPPAEQLAFDVDVSFLSDSSPEH